MESPSLEGFKGFKEWHLETWLVEGLAVLGEQLDSMVLKVFSNQTQSVILRGHPLSLYLAVCVPPWHP